MSLGKRLKEARKAKGLTLEKLAKLAGSSKGYLSDIENGKNPNPTINKIYHIAINLNVSIDWLVNDKELDINWQPIQNVPFNKMVLLAGFHEYAKFFTTGKIKESQSTFETYPFVGGRNTYYSDNIRIPKTVFTHFAELTPPEE